MPAGLPWPEHQCEAKRKNGKRCRKYKLKGARTCEFHGGRTGQRARERVRVDHLPRFWSKQLGPTLTAYVREITDSPPEDQTALYEHLALMQHAAGPAIALYDLACTKDNLMLQVEASQLMKTALKDCANLAEQIVRINAAAKDKISVHHIEYVVNQIVRIIYENVGEPEGRIVEKAIREKVKLPKSGVEGTSITPDMDATEMDGSIPTDA